MLFLKLVLSSTLTWAYLPPTKMILQRLAENNGSGVYQIEQELQFATAADPVIIHETWISEGEKGIRVIATGQNEQKDKFKFQALYAGGQKWTMLRNQKESQKIPVDMTERPFHIRSTEGLINWLVSNDILPERFQHEKAYTKDKEGHFTYPNEVFLRLARTGGALAYALGTTPTDSAKNPAGLWLEQDQFVIRKIRWADQSEMTVDDFGSYSRGLTFPKTRTFHWETQSVQMRTISVQGKTSYGQAFQVSNLESNHFETLDGQKDKDVLIDFYQRFR